MTTNILTIVQIYMHLLSTGCSDDLARIGAAVGWVESSGNPNAVGDNGLAKGIWQFHLARWKEVKPSYCMGKNVSFLVEAQAEAMANEMTTARRRRQRDSKGLDLVAYICRTHNGWGGTANQRMQYEAKVRRALAKLERELKP